MSKVEAGQKYGRWTVLEKENAEGEARWLCECDCGTKRTVLERSLKYGGSQSCGCLARERARGAVAYRLWGLRFGKLHVKAISKKKSPGGGICWECECDCGNTCIVNGSVLAAGKRTSCGCDRKYAYKDIQGQVFHRLTALYPLKERDPKGNVMWKCRCECGRETDVSYNWMVYGNIQSCGCLKQEHSQRLSGYLTHVADTCIDLIKSKKTPKNNTSGAKGVYLVKGKYVAKIVFQKKQYIFGSYDEWEEARAARLEAERLINDAVADYYEKWRQIAEADPEWGQEHPFQIRVYRHSDGKIKADLQPKLPEK